MIVYPSNWQSVGLEIPIKLIEETIFSILDSIDCNCISLSGGIDSNLILWFMTRIHNDVRAFTIGSPKNHPDIEYSKLAVSQYNNVEHQVFVPTQEDIVSEYRDTDLKGDDAVRLFYKYVGKFTDKIIACDGIDEFMCGYYKHQSDPSEKTYYEYIRKLQKEQLAPLHCNSGEVKVFLPYLDKRLLLLLSQIPISEKVNRLQRKRLMIKMTERKIPQSIINSRKYGFCDALNIKGVINES